MVKKDKTLEEVMQDETTIDTNGVMEDEINHIKRLNDTDGISTGITMLNLALSNNRKVGIKKGTLVSFASESGLGKTATALNVCANVVKDPELNKQYSIYYLDKEGSATNFNFQEQFGISENSIHVITAAMHNSQDLESLERTYLYLIGLMNKGKSIIAVVDSINAYIAECSRAVLTTNLNVVAGSEDKLGTIKEDRLGQIAAANSKYLPMLKEKAAATGSVIMLISQLRVNVGGGLYEPKTIISGGKGIIFNVDTAIKITKGEQIYKKSASGVELDAGFMINYKPTKNRINGVTEPVTVPFLRSSGLKDVKATIDYLVSTKQITDNRKRYTAEWLTGTDKSMTDRELRIFLRDNKDAREKMESKAEEVWIADLNSIYEDF